MHTVYTYIYRFSKHKVQAIILSIITCMQMSKLDNGFLLSFTFLIVFSHGNRHILVPLDWSYAFLFHCDHYSKFEWLIHRVSCILPYNVESWWKNELNRIHDTPGNGLRRTALGFSVVTSLLCHASWNDCVLKLNECPGKELQELEAQLNFHGKCALRVSFFRPIISQSTSLYIGSVSDF